MISYAPLWETMKKKGATTYILRGKGKDEPGYIGGQTVSRLKAGESVSTNTLDTLCRILDCDLSDIIRYIPDDTIT